MSHKVEVKEYTDPETSNTYKAIFVDGVVFDWYIDDDELKAAKRFANEETRKKSIIGDVVNFFLECFSEFVGKKVTLREVNEAIEKGCLE